MDVSSPESKPEKGAVIKWLSGPWALSGLAIILLIIVFYIEEDWRGAVLWQQAQAEVTAAGESLDPAKFIPAPVPDDQNFGALPLFQLERDPSGLSSHDLHAGAMDRALIRTPPLKISSSKESQKEKGSFPYLGNWSKGEQPDMPLIQKQLAERCRTELPEAKISSTTTPAEMFGMLCPALAELRAANKTHPYCQFNGYYELMPPLLRPFSGTVSQIGFAKVLSYQERLALFSKQPDLALEDLKVEWKINAGLQQEPMLVSGLVSLGVVAIQLVVVNQGLAEHSWSDQQLAELDHDLGQIDFLMDCQLCNRGELAVYENPNLDFFKVHRLRIREELLGDALDNSPRGFAYSCLILSLPEGWFDEYKSAQTRSRLLGQVKMMDPVAKRVYPEKEVHALRLINDSKGTGLWRYIFSGGFEITVHAVQKFAFGQVHVDEARIACRLERYRLAHGTYPKTLQELVPAYGAELPHDIMTGEPYKYRVEKDGNYVLYSVGWNKTDDGGSVYRSSNHADSDEPDWVWGNHPNLKPAK